MKKLLGIVVLGLLTCNISFADNLKIIDGDTIHLNGEKIRFSGIDTPEIKQTCTKNNETINCGIQAKELLVEIIANNKIICIHPYRVRLIIFCCSNSRNNF